MGHLAATDIFSGVSCELYSDIEIERFWPATSVVLLIPRRRLSPELALMYVLVRVVEVVNWAPIGEGEDDAVVG
jgi:hypothetical protein